MTYSISISGHKDNLQPAEGEQFEEGIAAQAREFVASLEGVRSAQISGQFIGSQSLTAAP